MTCLSLRTSYLYYNHVLRFYILMHKLKHDLSLHSLGFYSSFRNVFIFLNDFDEFCVYIMQIMKFNNLIYRYQQRPLFDNENVYNNNNLRR